MKTSQLHLYIVFILWQNTMQYLHVILNLYDFLLQNIKEDNLKKAGNWTISVSIDLDYKENYNGGQWDPQQFAYKDSSKYIFSSVMKL